MNGKSYRTPTFVALASILILLTALTLPLSVVAAESTWRGEYYNNENLTGAATFVREDANIDFNWGGGSPDARIPQDHFSVRWTRTLHLQEGRYRFYTRTDDGVRLFVDGRLLIDQWRPMPPTTHSGEINLSAGEHAIRMEYFERTGMASAKLWWQRISAPIPPDSAWKGEYFSNPWLNAPPVFARYDEGIDFDWGLGSPDSRIPADHFSIRWTRELKFKEGRYTFFVEFDDGVRLYLDDRLIIDDWRDGLTRTRKASHTLSGGRHTLRLEYYDDTGHAKVRLWWKMKSEQKRPVGNIITCMRPHDSWIKVYRRMSDDSWQDINPYGWGPIDPSGFMKIDGLPVEAICGESGQRYRVELWANGSLIRSVGDIDQGQPVFRIYPWTDNFTPWGCPAP